MPRVLSHPFNDDRNFWCIPLHPVYQPQRKRCLDAVKVPGRVWLDLTVLNHLSFSGNLGQPFPSYRRRNLVHSDQPFYRHIGDGRQFLYAATFGISELECGEPIRIARIYPFTESIICISGRQAAQALGPSARWRRWEVSFCRSCQAQEVDILEAWDGDPIRTVAVIQRSRHRCRRQFRTGAV
jgi:hypothetical protein